MKWGVVWGIGIALMTFCGFAGSLPAPYAPGTMPVNLAAYALADEPDYAAVHAATMSMTTDKLICSATAIGPSHHVILTAAHCLEQGLNDLRFGDRTARVLHVEDDGNDAVYLTTDLYFEHIAPLAKHRPLQGDVVFTYGNPSGTRDILLVGRVAGWVPEYTGVENVMLLDRNDWYGCSGGAVFNHDGEVLGVVNAIYPWPNKGWRLTAVFPLTFRPEQYRAGLSEDDTVKVLAVDLAEFQREVEQLQRLR